MNEFNDADEAKLVGEELEDALISCDYMRTNQLVETRLRRASYSFIANAVAAVVDDSIRAIAAAIICDAISGPFRPLMGIPAIFAAGALDGERLPKFMLDEEVERLRNPGAAWRGVYEYDPGQLAAAAPFYAGSTVMILAYRPGGLEELDALSTRLPRWMLSLTPGRANSPQMAVGSHPLMFAEAFDFARIMREVSKGGPMPDTVFLSPSLREAAKSAGETCRAMIHLLELAP